MLRMSEHIPTNGSAIIPSLRYRDDPAAIDWLCQVFGFRRNAIYENPDGTVAHAQLTQGAGMIMLGSAENKGPQAHLLAHPEDLGGRQTHGIYLFVENCDEVYAAVQAAKAKVVQELTEPEYGGKTFSCLDPEGYLWSIGSYNPWAHHG